MYPNKQDKNQKLRKVQGLYRKRKNKGRIENEENRSWTVFMNICYWALFLYIVYSLLFDIGIQLPSYFDK